MLCGAALFGAGTAIASPDHENQSEIRLTKLEDLRGLPCGGDTQFGEGQLDFRIFGPPQQSTIQWHCVTPETFPILDQDDIPYDLYPSESDVPEILPGG